MSAVRPGAATTVVRLTAASRAGREQHKRSWLGTSADPNPARDVCHCPALIGRGVPATLRGDLGCGAGGPGSGRPSRVTVTGRRPGAQTRAESSPLAASGLTHTCTTARELCPGRRSGRRHLMTSPTGAHVQPLPALATLSVTPAGSDSLAVRSTPVPLVPLVWFVTVSRICPGSPRLNLTTSM